MVLPSYILVNLKESTEDSPVEQQTEFTIQLTGFADGTKAKVIKEIKSIMEGMNLVQVIAVVCCGCTLFQ